MIESSLENDLKKLNKQNILKNNYNIINKLLVTSKSVMKADKPK